MKRLQLGASGGGPAGAACPPAHRGTTCPRLGERGPHSAGGRQGWGPAPAVVPGGGSGFSLLLGVSGTTGAELVSWGAPALRLLPPPSHPGPGVPRLGAWEVTTFFLKGEWGGLASSAAVDTKMAASWPSPCPLLVRQRGKREGKGRHGRS